MPYLPFAWIGAVVFVAATCATVLDPHLTGILSMVCGGLAFFIFMLGLLFGRSRDRRKRRNRRFFLYHAALVVGAACIMFALYANQYFTTVAPVRYLDQVTASVRLEPLDYPTQRYDNFYYPVRILELDGQPVVPFQVRLSCSEALECEPCDQVICQVNFYAFSSDGIYSTYSSQLAEGNLLGAYPIGYNAYEYVPNPDPLPAGRLLPMLRRYASRSLDRCISGDESALLQTVLLSQRSQLSDLIYTDFRQIGCSHMLAVSGLHMTLVGAFLSLLLARLPLPRNLRSLFSVLLLFLYLLLTGFPVSAVRSYIMFVFCTLASSTHQIRDSLNSLGAAVVLICFTGPFTAGSVGFALSVSATAGIALLASRLEKTLLSIFTGPIGKYVSGTLATSISATLATLPVQVAIFKGFPLLTLISNLLLLPIFVAMLYSALPLLLLALLNPSGALIQPFVLFCGMLARILLKLCHWMASFPNAYISLSSPIALVSIAFLLMAVVFFFSMRSKPRFIFITASLAMAVYLPLLYNEFRADYATVAVSGDSESACVVVMQAGQAAVLSMGTFNSELARQIISQENIPTINTILINGSQNYQSKTMTRDLMSNYRPKTLWICGNTYVGKDLRYPGVTLITMPDDALFQALPGLIVQVTDDGAKLCIWANNRKLVLALDECSEEVCDVLITNRSLPQVQTSFTLFMCDGGTTPSESDQKIYSDFSIVTDQRVTYLDIPPSGSMELYTS